MAKSKYEYVRSYEQDVRVAVNNFIVIRVDGRSFHRYRMSYTIKPVSCTFVCCCYGVGVTYGWQLTHSRVNLLELITLWVRVRAVVRE